MFFLQHNMRRRKWKNKNKNFSSFNFQKSFRFDFLFISILNGLKYHVRVFRNENIIHIYICVLFYCSFQIPIICHGIVNIFSLKFHIFYGKKRSKHTHTQPSEKETIQRLIQFVLSHQWQSSKCTIVFYKNWLVNVCRSYAFVTINFQQNNDEEI